MSKPLKEKISRSKKDESEKDALSEREYNGLLKMLRADTSLKGLQNLALIRFGVTSGMRAAELVNLRWENISELEGRYTATFTGKGNKVRTIQLEGEAVRTMVRAFRFQYHRKPGPADYVINSLPTGKVNRSGMSKSGVHIRIKAIIEAGKAQGIVRANLNVSTHSLRHTCATRLLAAGVDIETVRKHLGHSNVATTMIYLHNDVDLTGYFERIHQGAA